MADEEFLTGPDSLRAIDEVRAACRAADGADPLDEAADLRLRHGLDQIGAWVTPDGFALRRGEGGIGGGAGAGDGPGDGAGGRAGEAGEAGEAGRGAAEVDLAVAPGARGAGLGLRLATHATAAPGALTAWAHGGHPAAGRLAARLGFHAARELWVMRRPAVVPLEAAEPPPGVSIRDFGDSDADALLAVNRDAFRNHPEQGALDADGLAERMAEPWFDPAGLLLAVADTGELLGFHWTKQHDEATGEVYVVGVSPTAQGRGLGRILTVAGLQHLAARGVDEVLLYVESDNAPARSLYADLGFTHAPHDTHTQFRRAEVWTDSP